MITMIVQFLSCFVCFSSVSCSLLSDDLMPSQPKQRWQSETSKKWLKEFKTPECFALANENN